MDKRTAALVFLILLMAASFVVCLGVGRVSIPVSEIVRILCSHFWDLEQTWTASMYTVVVNVRLPRLLANVLIGGALALSGVTYQGMFKNPLVSPDLLGVSSGAGVGAAGAILLGFGGLYIQLIAFATSMVAVGITILIASRFKSKDNLVLVLSGIIVSGFMSSLLSFFRYIADPNTSLPQIVYWLMGSMASVGYDDLKTVVLPMLLCGVALIGLSWKINILSLGGEEAQTLGVNVRKFWGICIVCSTILTACAVSISGTIGWFGLVVPHVGRLLVGSVHEYLLPTSLVLGAIFMIVLDTFARSITGGELPISIMTGLIGAPVFTCILLRQRENF